MRRAWKWGLRALLLAVALPLAWVACNGRWADARPQPVPEALQPLAVTLPPERNAFLDMPGRDGPQPGASGPSGASGWPVDPLWHCKPAERSCVQAWRSERARMAELLAASRDFGQHCDSMAQADGFEELLPQRPASGPLADVPYVQLPLPRFQGLTNCLRWFSVRAVMAASAADGQAEMARANRLARLALAGARSLIGTMIGVVVLQNHWLLAADWATSTPGVDRTALVPLLAPLPAQALSPRAWVPHEARFFRELMADLMDERRGCDTGVDNTAAPSAERLWCRAKLGLLPELSIQANDARWLARLETVPAEGPVPCERLSQAMWQDTGSVWPAWRNTLGHWLLVAPGTDWRSYPARQLDLELLRQTLRAQLAGEPVPAGVQIRREGAAQWFSGCRAALQPGEAAAVLRLPLL